MENNNLDQYQNTRDDEVIEPKIQVSKDGKWLIVRLEVDGKKVSVIKPVAYFEKILQRAKTRTTGADYKQTPREAEW